MVFTATEQFFKCGPSFLNDLLWGLTTGTDPATDPMTRLAERGLGTKIEKVEHAKNMGLFHLQTRHRASWLVWI